MDARESPVGLSQLPRRDLENGRPRVNKIWLVLSKYESSGPLLVKSRNRSGDRKTIV